jgi:hypothetical protein
LIVTNAGELSAVSIWFSCQNRFHHYSAGLRRDN